MDDTKPAGTPAPESRWTAEDEAVFDVWTAEALGGCLFGLERLLFWLETRPELLEPIAQFSSLFADFSERLKSYHTGWTGKPGFIDPDFQPAKVRTLDGAFFGDGTPTGRGPEASSPSVRPDPLSLRPMCNAFRDAALAWQKAHPDKTIRAAFDELRRERFPMSYATQRRLYDSGKPSQKTPEN